jgi:hypothetical protein
VDFLTAEVAKAARQHSLKYLLHRKLSGYIPARPLSRIHASAVTQPDFCGRFYALSDLTSFEQKPEWLSTSQTVTFEIGKILQDSVLHWLADIGVAIGHWRCISCKSTAFFCRRPAACESCGCRAFKPIEVNFVSNKSGISGSFDCLYNAGGTKLRMVEIKTIDKDQFKTLNAPLPEHKIRTKLYLRLIGETDNVWAERINQEAATVLYISKGGFGVQDFGLAEMGLNDKFSPIKEFVIDRDDAETQIVSDKGTQVSDWRKGTAPMPPRLCKDAMAKEAKWCPLRAVCFSDAFPADTKPKAIPETLP